MKHPDNIPLVRTIRERCRVCYTCVRECPAKAIRIVEGQAEVIAERCIGCGNCVRVCSQHAKEVLGGILPVQGILASADKVSACLAPSFPAEFPGVDYRRVVGMVRALGFDLVNEVAFGADLVADRYRRMLAENGRRRTVATTCPAIVGYVERYYPRLVETLAPIVSPMVAIARALRLMHGADLKVVFVGPCIAKKGEAVSEDVAGDIDETLTFAELRELFEERGIAPESVEPSEFDPPRAGVGAIFPVTRGLLQAAGIEEDLTAPDIVSAEGRGGFLEAIREFDSGHLDARLLEVLCCDGCIMGPGITSDAPRFQRRACVSRFAHERLEGLDRKRWDADIAAFADLDLSRAFRANDQRIPVQSEDEIRAILERMGKTRVGDELNCGACGYDTCYDHAVAIYKGLAESEMCLPYMIEQLRRTVSELNLSNDQLASTQQALLQAEKMASMGQLAAGIAHEVNNPLGVVLMYAHLLLDECPHGSPLREDLQLIAEQADRCKKIVAGLLNFARRNKVVLQPTDLAALAERIVRAIRLPETIEIRVERSSDRVMAEVDADQIIQVLTNLVSNAEAAMPDGGTLTLSLSSDAETARIRVRDTGIGIPKTNLEKIFDPFFSTKQMGMGTGLGLAVTYGILKMHRGDIQVESNADPEAGPTGTTFTITLPRNAQQD